MSTPSLKLVTTLKTSNGSESLSCGEPSDLALNCRTTAQARIAETAPVNPKLAKALEYLGKKWVLDKDSPPRQYKGATILDRHRLGQLLRNDLEE